MKTDYVKKVLVVGIIVLFIGVGFASSTQLKNNHLSLMSGKTIYVDDDNTEGPWDGTQEHPYQTIKAGINTAKNGDIVYVFNGLYEENYIEVNKKIKIMGQDRDETIIQSEERECRFIFEINHYSVTIQGFTIKARANFQTITLAASFCTISGNKIINDFEVKPWAVGIRIGGLRFGNTISYNIIRNCEIGIDAFSTKFNIIFNNHLENNLHGIAFNYVTLTKIYKNNFIENDNNAYFVAGSKIEASLIFWKNNYWDDWIGIGPYIIHGTIRIDFYDYIDGNNYDWRPARKPYDITTT